MPDLPGDWFGVRCVFEIYSASLGGDAAYEERVTLWRANTFDEAIAMAEDEAASYANDIDARYLGLAQAYALSEEPTHGGEVFSLMRDSELSSAQYLTGFFDTGRERQRDAAS
jgi:hypothetical protein